MPDDDPMALKSDSQGDLSLQQLAHELASRLDGSMRTLRLALRDLPESADAEVFRRRLAAAESAMGDMAVMLERSMRPAGGTGRGDAGDAGNRGADRAASHASALVSARRLGEEARMIVALHRERAAESGIDLHLHLGGEVEAVPAGPLGTILINGIRNAIEAIERSGSRGGCVEVSVDARDSNVQITIVDDGPGLSGPAGTPAFGHGLGLAICRHVAESCGGRVELSSVPGRRGAILCADIPLSRLEGA